MLQPKTGAGKEVLGASGFLLQPQHQPGSILYVPEVASDRAIRTDLSAEPWVLGWGGGVGCVVPFPGQR